MLQFNVFHFYITVRNLHSFQQKVSKAIEERGREDYINKQEMEAAYDNFADARSSCEVADLKEALDRLNYYRVKLINPALANPRSPYKMTLDELYWEIENLRRAIERGLREKLFTYIPTDKAAYYDKPKLFGADVKEKFPKANKEIQEAGNCYATGNNTACVFHLMRAVEYGARKMVSTLQARKYLPHPNRPIELCDWGELVIALEKGVATLAVGTRTSVTKKARFEFYNHAVAQFRNFKDAWRNNVSHTRKVYQASQTKDIMDNTRQFMQHLAERLKE
jgi:hypothetical protein